MVAAYHACGCKISKKTYMYLQPHKLFLHIFQLPHISTVFKRLSGAERQQSPRFSKTLITNFWRLSKCRHNRLQQYWQCLITQITVDCLCANNISRLAKTDYMSTTLWGGLAEKNTSACDFKSYTFCGKIQGLLHPIFHDFSGVFQKQAFSGNFHAWNLSRIYIYGDLHINTCRDSIATRVHIKSRL